MRFCSLALCALLLVGTTGCGQQQEQAAPSDQSRGEVHQETATVPQAATEVKDPDPVELFKTLVADKQEAVATFTTVWQNSALKGWARIKFDFLNPAYDVKKTDSLVSPYAGILSFESYLHSSPGLPRREDAEAFVAWGPTGSPRPYRAQYVFQDAEWVLKVLERKEINPQTSVAGGLKYADDWTAIKPGTADGFLEQLLR